MGGMNDLADIANELDEALQKKEVVLQRPRMNRKSLIQQLIKQLKEEQAKLQRKGISVSQKDSAIANLEKERGEKDV